MYLKRNVFKVSDSPNGVTTQVRGESSKIDGITRYVIDTEGLNDGEKISAPQIQNLAKYMRLYKDGVEMFVNLTNVMDSKSAQPISSVELKYGTFIHFFWSAYDVILVGISDKRIPSATSKNNVIALLNSIRNILSE